MSRGLTQEALAERADVSTDMICRIESRRTTPTIGTARKLSRGLGVPIETLVTSGDALTDARFEEAVAELEEAVRRFVEITRLLALRPRL